jgi:phytoene dehydrogenase-like protein
MTTPNTVAGRRGPSWMRSSLPCSTRAWRRPESTSCRSSCNMPPPISKAAGRRRSAQFLDVVIDTLAEHAPDLRDKILHKHLNTPDDLEQTFGITGGHIFHGELALHQLFFLKPAPGIAQYKSPIKNLWMCGASTHPGGLHHRRAGAQRRAGDPPRGEGREVVVSAFDVAIVGSSPNALAAAARLAAGGPAGAWSSTPRLLPGGPVRRRRSRRASSPNTGVMSARSTPRW